MTKELRAATPEEVDGMESFARDGDAWQNDTMTGKWCYGYMLLILRIRELERQLAEQYPAEQETGA